MRGVALPGQTPHFDASAFPATMSVTTTTTPFKKKAGPRYKPVNDEAGNAIPITLADPASFEGIKPLFPETLDETTGDFTKSINPTARYFKSPVWFDKISGTNPGKYLVTKIKDVVITPNPARSTQYGDTYVVAGIPKHVVDWLQKSLNGLGVGIRGDPSYKPDPNGNYVWTTLNNTKDLLTTVSSGGGTKAFDVKELLIASGSGFVIDLDAILYVKTKTFNGSDFKKGVSTLELAVNAVRGMPRDINFPMDPPHVVNPEAVQSNELRTTKKDATSDDILNAIISLNISESRPKADTSRGKGTN